MYSGSGFSDWEIGDITVIIHRGKYHLFHLIIPNHDYIAHAVSNDGISWKRTKNALFVGDPGEWDDDMLWTMHVCEEDGRFVMYYTGLQRKDRGVISRVGLAESNNLSDWTKNNTGIFPIEPKGIFYETFATNPRTWLSFRDPFRFDYKGERYLLVASRGLSGPVSRRGCVGLVKITDETLELMPPLFNPFAYDDVECPCVFELHGRFYLIGSIREDIKVRYWFAPDFFGEYHSFHIDVLLPQGNYAARTVVDGEHVLIYNFFYTYGKINSLRVLPPPKQLDTDKDGRLVLKRYYRWAGMVSKSIRLDQFLAFSPVFLNPTASSLHKDGVCTFSCRSGYEIFAMAKPASAFIWEGKLAVEGLGKFGLVCDMDSDGNGYFISFNITTGEIKIRSWGFNPLNTKENFIFTDIQNNFFTIDGTDAFYFSLLRYGHYIELSVNGVVKLTLIDYSYSGNSVGIYSSSSVIVLSESEFKILPEPQGEYASQEDTE